MAVRTEDQYSPVRLELARLVSSLLYGTRVMLVCFLLKRTSGHLHLKGFRRVFDDDASRKNKLPRA